MEVNYFIKATTSTQIDEVSVQLSAEYTKDSRPTTVDGKCVGYTTIAGQGERKYVSVNFKYDAASKSFTQLNGSNVSMEFMDMVMPIVDEFYAAVTAEPINELNV